MGYDSAQYVASLTQALSQDKRPIAFLIGAGCPVSVEVTSGGVSKALIPAIAGLTSKVAGEIAKGACAAAYKNVATQLEEDGVNDPNIEQVLTRIRSLAQVAGKKDARGLTTKELESLDAAVCDEIANVTACDLPVGNCGYTDLATWIEATRRAFPIEIFTTNYDLLLEQALEQKRVPYFDGFIGSCDAFFDLHAMEEDPVPSRWARLWKIHGSLNWYDKNGEVIRTARQLTGRRRVIHPSHLKYDESRKMPYLAMTDRLRAFLRRPAATIITAGYSFGDQHINSTIDDGLRGNPTAIAFGLMSGILTKRPAAKLLAESRSNLCLIARDQAVVGGKAAAWLDQSSGSVPANTTAITWTALPGGTTFRPTVEIGNFRILGALCRELVGEGYGI